MDEIAPKIVAGERRLSMLLMGYWRETRADRRAPLERALKRAVPPDLFADCFVYLPARISCVTLGTGTPAITCTSCPSRTSSLLR